jgi:hypothetical protein
MSEKKPQGRGAQERPRCQIDHYFPDKLSSSCAEPAKVNVDGLILCEGHALEAKLEGQIVCWDGILAHVDLWSREATRRGRPDVVGLLEVQRVKATSAMDRAHEDLDLLRSESSGEEAPSVSGRLFRRGSLPLPPKADRPHSRGLRRRSRRWCDV